MKQTGRKGKAASWYLVPINESYRIGMEDRATKVVAEIKVRKVRRKVRREGIGRSGSPVSLFGRSSCTLLLVVYSLIDVLLSIRLEGLAVAMVHVARPIDYSTRLANAGKESHPPSYVLVVYSGRTQPIQFAGPVF